MTTLTFRLIEVFCGTTYSKTLGTFVDKVGFFTQVCKLISNNDQQSSKPPTVGKSFNDSAKEEMPHRQRRLSQKDGGG